MKKLFIGLMAFTSISAFAGECSVSAFNLFAGVDGVDFKVKTSANSVQECVVIANRSVQQIGVNYNVNLKFSEYNASTSQTNTIYRARLSVEALSCLVKDSVNPAEDQDNNCFNL